MKNWKEKTLYNCYFVKMVLMLLIIVGHSASFWTGEWFTHDPIFECPGLSILSKWLGSFHTFTFVLVSGYIFSAKLIGGVQQVSVIPAE